MRCHTLRGACSFSGKGIHRGTPGHLVLRPSRRGKIGVVFGNRRFALENAAVQGGARGTVLRFPSGGELATAEHLLGALFISGIWSVDIHVESGDEVPIGDGSAAFFCEKLLPLREALPEEIAPGCPISPLAAGEPGKGSFVAAFPAERFGVTYTYSRKHPLIGSQIGEFFAEDALEKEIAPARTFGFFEEVEALRKRGLALGGALENAVVFSETGVLNPEGLRFPDECVRHKVLDLLGDLMLLGKPLKAHVVAFRAGHALHLKLVRRLRRALGEMPVSM